MEFVRGSTKAAKINEGIPNGRWVPCFPRFSTQNVPATEPSCPSPKLGSRGLGTGQAGCFFPKHRELWVYSEGLSGSRQEDRDFSERNTTWHLAAKTPILSENIDVCERVVSDGVWKQEGTLLATQALETRAHKGADSSLILHSKLRVLVAHKAIIVSGPNELSHHSRI